MSETLEVRIVRAIGYLLVQVGSCILVTDGSIVTMASEENADRLDAVDGQVNVGYLATLPQHEHPNPRDFFRCCEAFNKALAERYGRDW